MCNIVAYAGQKPAAPILIDMIRRSAIFDGGYSTGIATIHEGRIYWRKMTKGIEEFVNETDVMELPGTIGFIHSRPANNFYEYAHPYVSSSGRTAIVTNGTCSHDKYEPIRNATVNKLYDAGYHFRSARFAREDSFPQLKTGEYVANGEATAFNVEYNMNQGLSLDKAFAKSCDEMFSDFVTLMLSLEDFNHIRALRTCRPMYVLKNDGESYMATCDFAFPENVNGEVISIPTTTVCKLGRGTFEITNEKTTIEEIKPLTPELYEIAYERMTEMLKGKASAPLTYDDVEVPFWKEMPELWGDSTYYQFAPLVYETLSRLRDEGKLKMQIRPKFNHWGQRNLAFMWID